MERILAETNGANFETLKRHYQVGSRCTSCEYEIKDLIAVYRERQQQARVSLGGSGVSLGRRLGTWFRELKLSIRPLLTVRRFGIFVLRTSEYESSLVLSNLPFAEDGANANGKQVFFRATLFDSDGVLVGRSRWFRLLSDESHEFWLHDLFPNVTGTILGMVLIDFKPLKEVGSLRPYCCFNFGKRDGEYRGRWHYHDKFREQPYVGYYHCNHPVVAGQECWMAISNCIATPYSSTAVLRLPDGTELRRRIQLPPFSSQWLNVDSLFDLHARTEALERNSLLWLESNQALMVWFFWHKIADDLWLVQHH